MLALLREVPSTMGPEAAYLVMSSAAHVMHGAHALHQALQDGAHPVAPRFLALVRETIHRLTELMEMAQEFTIELHMANMRRVAFAEIRGAEWTSQRKSEISEASARLGYGAGVWVWKVQLAGVLHGLARVCPTKLAESLFSRTLQDSVCLLAALYLGLSPSPAWHPRFAADCQAVLATVLSYCNKMPTMPALKIPSSPGNFNPPPMEPAGPPTAAGGVCVLRLPAVNSLSELLRYLCTRAALLTCPTDKFISLLPELATRLATTSGSVKSDASEQTPAVIVAKLVDISDLEATGHHTEGSVRGREDSEQVPTRIRENRTDVQKGFCANPVSARKQEWSWLEPDWRIALQDPAVQLGLPFDPLFATALSPQICKEERTQTQDGVCVPSPSKVPRENAWSQLLNSLIASAPPDEALAALWMRWELQVENTNIVLQDEDKDRRSQMLKAIAEAKLPPPS